MSYKLRLQNETTVIDVKLKQKTIVDFQKQLIRQVIKVVDESMDLLAFHKSGEELLWLVLIKQGDVFQNAWLELIQDWSFFFIYLGKRIERQT